MLSNNRFRTGVDFYHRLNLSFNLIIAIPLVPFTLLYLGSMRGLVPLPGLDAPMMSAVNMLISAAVVFIGYRAVMVYRSGRLEVRTITDLRQKLIGHHHLLIALYTKLALAGGLSIAGFWLTQGKVHVVSFVILLVVFSLNRPSLKKIVEELALDEHHSSILREREVIP